MSHIALFLPDLNGGGAERVMLTLAKNFAGHGHRVDLVLARAEGAFLPLAPAEVRLVDLRAGLKRWGLLGLALAATVQLVRYLRREKPTALLSTLTGANLVAVLARILAGSSAHLVLREAATLENIKSQARLFLMRYFYRKADRVIALTEVMRQQLITMIGLPKGQVVRIANPVDINFIQQQSAIPLDHEHVWFQNSAVPVVLGVGRLSIPKDFSTLILAFVRVIETISTARLVILGEGPLRNQLEALVTEHKINDYVDMPGFDPNPYRWLSQATVFVLSSRWEGYPNVMVEALGLGTAVVATAYDPSIQEFLLQDRVTVVPVGEPERMAKAILEKLSNASKDKVVALPEDVGCSTQCYLGVLLNLNNTDTS